MKMAIVGNQAGEIAKIANCTIPVCSAEAIEREKWDFLAFTRDGAEALAHIKDVQCHTLLIPDDVPISPLLQAIQVVAYGFSPRDSLTVSGEGLLCVQRRLQSIHGTVIEPQEILLDATLRALPSEQALLAIGLQLLTN